MGSKVSFPVFEDECMATMQRYMEGDVFMVRGGRGWSKKRGRGSCIWDEVWVTSVDHVVTVFES